MTKTIKEDLVWLYEDYKKELSKTSATQYADPTFEGFMHYINSGYIEPNIYD